MATVTITSNQVQTWPGTLTDALGDAVAPYIPGVAKALWQPAAAALLTGAVIVALMFTIQRKL